MVKISHFNGLHQRVEEINLEKKEGILKTYPAPIVPEAGTNINDLPLRSSAKVVAAALSFKMGGGKPNANLTMSNGNKFTAKLWGDKVNLLQVQEWIEEKKTVFHMEGDITEFNGQKQFTVRTIVPVNDITPAAFLPYTKENPEDLTLELFNEISKLPEEAQEFFKNYFNLYWDDFRMMPAAKGFHHSYNVGLLTHSLGNSRVCYDIYNNPNPADRMKEYVDYLAKLRRDMKEENKERKNPTNFRYLPLKPDDIAHLYLVHQLFEDMLETESDSLDWTALYMGCILHDGGKIYEYAAPGTNPDKWKLFFPDTEPQETTMVEMDPIGVKHGHIYLGLKMMRDAMLGMKKPLPYQLVAEVEHLILSHHFKLEWGSPVMPQNANALLLHFADFADSRFAAWKEWAEKH